MRPVGPELHPVSPHSKPQQKQEQQLFVLPDSLTAPKHATNRPAMEWLVKELSPEQQELPSDKETQQSLSALNFLLVVKALGS